MTTSQLEFVPFPYADAAYDYAGQKLADNWDRLHQGDAEPWPEDEQVQDAWRAYHAGDFAKAVALGEAAGEAGLNVANKALVIHASYLLEDKYAKRAAFERRPAMPRICKSASPITSMPGIFTPWRLVATVRSSPSPRRSRRGLATRSRRALRRRWILSPITPKPISRSVPGTPRLSTSWGP